MKKAFKHLATAINWVEHVNKFRPKQNLQRISKAWEILNLDLSTITKIQVIGTNGKGSTTHFISNIYKINNYKVGTFTSPYLVSFNERIQINGQEIDDKTLLNLLNFIYDFNNNFTESFGESLIFFEMLTLMALKYFVDEKCHIIVMEAGIGGLLDSTSVLKYDAVCLTNVGLDHQKILGLSKEEILINKLGALKPQGLLLTTEISLKKLIKSEAQRVNFKVIFVNDKVEVISYFPLVINYFNEIIRSPLLGEYQIKNIALSIRCALTLHPNFLISSCKEAIEGVNFPGRLEYLNKHTIIDGAHNISAIECVVEALKHFDYDQIFFLFSSLKDKNHQPIIEELQKISSNITLTSFPDSRIFDPVNLVIKYNLEYIPDPFLAYSLLSSRLGEKDLIVILGSIHFIGYLKSHQKNLKLIDPFKKVRNFK